MPDGELIVADTSPLLNLALIGQLNLLREQFNGVTAPDQVWDELAVGEKGLDQLRELREVGFLELVPVEESHLFIELRRVLDLDEAAALAYAIEAEADLVLLDERDARQVARRHDLSITGVIGILLRTAQNNRIDLQSELDRLRSEGFWIGDDLYHDVLEDANVD